jgi:enamine deaminase RidA (YjgF/YER057c/UK114 family)
VRHGGAGVGQAEEVVVNLRAALNAAGANLLDVVKTTVSVASGRQEESLSAWEVCRPALR